jgi:ATP-dependent protease ClpP protease subunit
MAAKNQIIDDIDIDINVEKRDIYLFNDFIDHEVAKNFLKGLRILEKKKDPIIIHQLSNGGDINSGMAMYDAIKNSPCNFIFITYGLSASMGTIIPQAVLNKGYILTMPNCSWLLHEGYASIEDNQKVVKSYMDFHQSVINNFYNIFVQSFRKSEQFKDQKDSLIKKYIKQKVSSKIDWWLSAQEAVSHGLADDIYTPQAFNKYKATL